MARILLPADGRWYDELSAVAYYLESELEKWILQHGQSVFPDHFLFPFKKDIVSLATAVRKRPDLALIRRDFSDWAIVEVEVGKHPLGHVLEQTAVFKEAHYNAAELAEYAKPQLAKFCNKNTSLKRLTELFSGHAPSVLVIADVQRNGWQDELSQTGVNFCIFEIYKNVVGHFVYRTLGQYPTVPAEEAHCRPDASIPNLIEVIGNFTFKNWRKGKYVEIIYDQYLTQWDLLRENGKQYLRSVGSSNPLSPNTTYGLFRDRANRYYFRRS